MRNHEQEFRVRSMCRVLGVHPSGYYAWRREPLSARARDDRRVLGLIKQSWLESGSVYGYRKVTRDLRDLGERCGKHRVARLMRGEGLRAQVGYRRRPSMRGGKPTVVADNHLARQFDPDAANRAWVTDITYIRTHEGWLYLAAVMDLFSRKIVGWAMGPTMHTDLVLQALMAVWRRKPPAGLLVHSDQGTQYTGHDWQDFLKAHGLVSSMSRAATVTTTPSPRASSSSSSASASGAGSTRLATTPGPMSSTTSRCSTTPAGSTATTMGCLR